MDIITQLQEQVNTIASIAFNTFGTLQRDAPPVQLAPNYPEPPANSTATEDAGNVADQPKLLSSDLMKAAKQFDVLVAALPLSEGGEEAQMKRIAELQAENDEIGQELQKQLETADIIALKKQFFASLRLTQLNSASILLSVLSRNKRGELR